MAPYSASAFANFATIQMGLGKYDKALRYGDLALKIGKVHGRTDSDAAAVVSLLLSHWSRPFKDLEETLDWFTKQSVERGYVSPAIVIPLWCHLLAGENLVDLEHRFRSFHSAVRDFQQNDATVLWMLPSYQYILNLGSEKYSNWRNLTELTGEVMRESDYIVRALEADEETRWSIFWTYKLQLEYHFGYHSTAETTFENLKPSVMKSIMAYHMHSANLVVFMGSLNFYAQSRERAQAQNLWRARRYKRYIEMLKVSTRPNIMPLLAI
jgi:hypothetical protein